MHSHSRAGDLNRRVAIERLRLVDDNAGGQEEDWSHVAFVWCKATPVGGKETLVAGTLHDAQGWRVEMRYRSDVTAADRLAATWLPDRHRISIESVSDPDGSRTRLVIFGTATLAFELADPPEADF